MRLEIRDKKFRVKNRVITKNVPTMKKIHLLPIVAAVFAVASCNDSEVLLENQPGALQEYIGFSNFTDLATRASVQPQDLEEYHTTFSVYATKKSTVDPADPVQYVFGQDASAAGGNKAGTVVTWQKGATAPNEWTYSPYRFWDKQATYYFVAFAPASAPLALNYYDKGLAVNNASNNIVTTAAYALGGQNLQGTAATTDQIYKGFDNAAGNDCDIMVAPVVYEEGASHNADVTLFFQHILAKLNVTVAKAAILDNSVVKVQSLTIDNLLNKGTYSNNMYDGGTYTSGWSTADYTSSTYTLQYQGAETTLNAHDGSKYYFLESLVMPQVIADAQSTLTLRYSIETGTAPDTHLENYIRTIDLNDAFTSFFDRYNYTLNLTIEPEIITFDASAVDWSDYSKDNTIH